MKCIRGVMFLLLFSFHALAGWELIWSDEFDHTGLPDQTKWDYDVGTGSGGWGNNELQYYMKESLKNARVENGTLILTAHRERMEQCDYTSTRLVTRDKGDWIYGRFEIAAKLPQGRGLWPAIWMLPTEWLYKEWPKSGELDIMENVGFDPYTIHFNIHTEDYNHVKKTNKGDTLKLSDPHTSFNVYALEWYEDSVVFFANDRKAFTFRNEHKDYKTWPFDQRFHLLLNIAVGGNWGGMEGVDTTIFPAQMIIDYVRVYRYSLTRIKEVNVGMPPEFRNVFTYKNGYVNFQKGNIKSFRIYDLMGKMITDCQSNTYLSTGVSLKLPQGVYHIIFTDGKIKHNDVFQVIE